MAMTRGEAIKTLHELWRETNDAWYKKVFNMAIQALSKPSGDLISRADAIKTVWNAYIDAINFGDSGEEIASDIDIILSALPSAEAVQGEWIRVGHDIYECSLCRQNVMTKDIECYSYCHRCGARMLREDGESK